jgi:hypothetical protein
MAGGVAAAMAMACLSGAEPVRAQTMWDNPDGHLGTLAPENLNMKRPAAPVDFTGTWQIDMKVGWQFKPMPKLKPDAQAVVDAQQKAAAEGKAADQFIGQCWPPGMPVMMTRVWPMNMVQIPTALIMVANFENQVRWVFMDGREHSDPDLYVPTYNGESIGHWEGKELVIHTQGFATEAHRVDGVPISDQFQITERMSMSDDGETIDVYYTMTDPVNWEGEWKSHKRYHRMHNADFLEGHCLPNTNDGIPGLGDAYQVDTDE